MGLALAAALAGCSSTLAATLGGCSALAATLGGCSSALAKHDRPGATVHLIPQSASFVTPSLGWAWGPARWPTAAKRVAGVLARTIDDGLRWTVVRTPPLAYGQSGIMGTRFLSRVRGYLFGSELFATTDEGTSWHRVSVPGRVLDLESGGGAPYALALDCGRCARAHLYRIGRALTRIGPPVTRTWWSLRAEGASVYLLTPSRLSLGSDLWASHDRGRSWQALAAPCQWSGALATWSPSGLALACGSQPAAGNQAKAFYTSTNGGRSWRLVGKLPFGAGYVASLAAADPDTWALGEARGQIELSTDGGRRWRPSRFKGAAAGVEGWGSISFSDHLHGVAVPWTLNGDVLAFTSDGGRSWRKVSFASGPQSPRSR